MPLAAVILLIILLAIILCGLLVPVDITVCLEKTEGLTRRVFSAVWGILGIESVEAEESETKFQLLGHTVIRKKRERKQREKPKAEGKKVTELMRLLPQSAPHLMKLIRVLMKSTSIGSVSCDATIGLSDPSDTGMLFGYFMAFRPVLRRIDRLKISLNPVFDRQILEGWLRASVRIRYPIRIIAAAIGMFTKKPVRHLVKTMRQFG